MATPAAVPSEDNPLAWMKFGVCHGVDTNVFFPGTDDAKGIAAAKGFCKGCRVKRDCLAFAYSYESGHDTNLDLGIYGGLTYRERRLEKRRLRTIARRSNG